MTPNRPMRAFLDPTATPTLQERRKKVTSELENQSRFKALTGGAPALVLSGGGAKGAYQAGVILALYDCGVRNYAVVAGTSVGGLNAALCQQFIRKGKRRLILKMWRNLSFTKVLGLRRSTVLKFALYLPMSGLAHLNVLDLQMFRTALRPDMATAGAREWVLMPLLVVIGMVMVVSAGLFFFVLMTLLLGPVMGAFGLSEAAGTAVFFLLVLWLMPLIAGWASRRMSIFTNAPLRKMVEAMDVDDVRLGTPEVICTIADEPAYRRGRPTPLYTTLAKTEDRDTAVEILMQSAAIPEVFPMRPIWDGSYVDGGVADNTPILGIAGANTKNVIVVYLDHRMNRVPGRYRKWGVGLYVEGRRILWRRSGAFKSYEAERFSELVARRGESLTAVKSWFAGVDYFAIVPRMTLGGFLRGTMNFTARKARSLIALGYEDTLLQLREWCLEEPELVREMP